MISRVLKKLSLLTLLLVVTACATMPPKAPEHQTKGDYSYLKEYMTWFIQKEMKDNDIVGLSIALVDDQEIVWQRGFGHADRKNKIEATPETIYRAGSISKLFNGMAAMKLVEDGTMDIDRPLVTYLPEFEIKSRFGSTDGITPRTIMTHHSGLPSDWGDGMLGKTPHPFTVLVQVIKDEYVAYPPNTVLSYSNLGVALLGHAVQNSSGQPYADFIDESLLKPMGMTTSRFETGISGNRAAKSYNEGKEVIEYPLGDIPAGGLNTTATDLARLAMMINSRGRVRDRQVLSPETLDAMFTVQNNDVPLDLDNSVGLAWFIDENILDQKETVYLHGGSVVAHRAMFMSAPKSKLGVVVLSNTGSTDAKKIAEELLKKAWESKNGEKLSKGNSQCIKNAKHSKPSFSPGTYATLIGKVDVTEKSVDRFEVKSSLGKFNLDLEKDNLYHLSYRLWGFIPIDLDELGEAGLTTEIISGHRVIVAQFGQLRVLGGVKVKPYPIQDQWKNRLGQYKLINPPDLEFWKIDGFELKIEDGYMVDVVTHDGEDHTTILRPENANEAIVEGLGRGFGETLRVIKDEAGKEILTRGGLKFMRIDN